jgi:alkyl hydroperoxide reductase subunit AhpC
MSIHLGDIAPDFTADTTKGPISFYEWMSDSWVLLFSHPADFTPVCTTELGKTALLSDDFKKRGVKVIAISVDDLESHNLWIPDIEEVNSVEVNFPIIADPEKKVALLYDMIHPNASEKATVRSVFIIGPDKKIKLTLTYPASTGRNFTEILRVTTRGNVNLDHGIN